MSNIDKHLRTDLLIASALETAKQLRKLQDSPVADAIFELIVENENGKEIQFERPISDLAFAAFWQLEKLVTALEVAEKRIAELQNDEVRQRLANAEHQLHMAELAKHNLRASRKAQFRKRKVAERRIAELEARTVTLPENITSANAPEVFEISAEAERLGLRGTYAPYAVGWNARGMADKEALRAASICIDGES